MSPFKGSNHAAKNCLQILIFNFDVLYRPNDTKHDLMKVSIFFKNYFYSFQSTIITHLSGLLLPKTATELLISVLFTSNDVLGKIFKTKLIWQPLKILTCHQILLSN